MPWRVRLAQRSIFTTQPGASTIVYEGCFYFILLFSFLYSSFSLHSLDLLKRGLICRHIGPRDGVLHHGHPISDFVEVATTHVPLYADTRSADDDDAIVDSTRTGK